MQYDYNKTTNIKE